MTRRPLKIVESSDEVGENDDKNFKTIVLEDGKEIHAYRQGPYGFWKLKYDHGMISDRLRSEFTKFSVALDQVRAYFESKNIKIKEVKD